MDRDYLEKFRKRIDSNLSFISKRRLLNTISILLILIVFTGATFKEANTFIFKIEFSNQHGLCIFLLISVFVLMIRYYSYAHEYHQELFKFIASRMMNDYKFFKYHSESEEICGIIANAITIYVGDEFGLLYAEYEKDGFFKRRLKYEKFYANEDGEEYIDEYISLNRYTEKWDRKDFFKVILFEIKYEIEALLKYRENLDLIGPYVLGTIAILLTLIKLNT